ncbi:hypothetical protein ACFVHI_28670 [Kitasatospora sp. NPDC127121]|uniref:hypothetical protein n=1 Tax=Kitasatospora sp. NPDC127121 TaxID=3345371 RepID=UPI00363F24BD
MNGFEYLLGMLLAQPVRARDALRARLPTTRRLRALASSPQVEALRAAERERIRRMVEGLAAVEGVTHLLTRVADHCDRPASLGLLTTTAEGRGVLVCRMSAAAYFATGEDITAVLPRIGAAGLADWGFPNTWGDEPPYSPGTVAYALRYHRDRGLFPDGRRMPGPSLSTADATLVWDLPGIPRPDPYWPRPGSDVHFRHEQIPPDADPAALLRAARAEGRGPVLVLTFGRNWTDTCTYHAVPRGRGRRHGREPG